MVAANGGLWGTGAVCNVGAEALHARSLRPLVKNAGVRDDALRKLRAHKAKLHHHGTVKSSDGRKSISGSGQDREFLAARKTIGFEIVLIDRKNHAKAFAGGDMD